MPTEMELTLEQTQQGVSYEVSMEILLEPTSNKLMVERFDTSAGNHVKEILLKLSLPDHRIFKDGGEVFIQPPLSLSKTLSKHSIRVIRLFYSQDPRSQDGKDNKDKHGKDLKISEQKTKSKDNDKGSRSKITKREGTSLQHDKDQRFKNSTTKQSQQVQGRNIQDLTSGIQRSHIRGDCYPQICL
ncbi:hypothetical protein Tco_1376981 [Tanacetum coccineum]